MPEEYSRSGAELNFAHYYPLDLKVSHVSIRNMALDKNWNRNKGTFVEIPEKVFENYARSRFQSSAEHYQDTHSHFRKTLYVMIDQVVFNPIENNTESTWSFLKDWLPIQREENYELVVMIGLYVLDDRELKTTPVIQADTITLRRIMRLHESMTLEQREAMQKAFLHGFIEDLDVYIQETLQNKLLIL